MGRSKGTIISVKVPINWDAMTTRTQQRLRQIVGRDTRVIRAFLGIIEQYENKLLTGRKKNKIHDGKLDELTLTAIKVRTGYGQRTTVPHDIKKRFPRISANELQECRQTAVALYESYLALKQKKGWKASRPSEVNRSRRMPRWVFSLRFKIEHSSSTVSKWWFNLRDTLDSVQAGKHSRLKARKKKSSSKGKSLLSKKESTSDSGESAAVHFVQSDLISFSDGASGSDNDPAVVKTVETLSVAGSDAPAVKQEKEARSSGGIPSR